MNQKSISPSGLKRFRECPLKWWYRYESDVEPAATEQKYLKMGSAVHEAIEANLKGVVENNTATAIPTLYREKADDVPDDMWDVGLECCEKAVEWLGKQDTSAIRDVERRIHFDIDRPEVSAEFVGVMDVTTETEIWDWKTGRIRDETPKNEEIQAAVYAAAYNAAYGDWPERIHFLYLKEDEKRTLSADTDIASTAIQYANALVRSKRKDEWPAKPGDNCYWCGYKYHCSETPVGCGDVEWGEYRA